MVDSNLTNTKALPVAAAAKPETTLTVEYNVYFNGRCVSTKPNLLLAQCEVSRQYAMHHESGMDHPQIKVTERTVAVTVNPDGSVKSDAKEEEVNL